MSTPTAIHALSTMWSQGRFPHKGRDSMARFAETASRLGFPAVEINYVIPPEGVEGLLASNHLSIVSLHSPTPRLKAGGGRRAGAGGGRGGGDVREGEEAAPAVRLRRPRGRGGGGAAPAGPRRTPRGRRA